MDSSSRSDRACRLSLGVLGLAFVAIMTIAQAHKLASFEMGFDLALQEQVVWNTAHGRWLATSTLATTDIDLGRDVILLDALLAIPYKLFPDTRTLLFLQTLAVAAGLIPLYALGRRHVSPLAGLAFGAAYLAYKPLHFLNLYEFQLRAFALAPLLGMFYFLESEKLRPFLLCAVLALCSRSDIALVVAMFGVYSFVARKPRRFALSALALGAGWFAVAVLIVVPRFNNGSGFHYFEWYQHLGATPSEALHTMATDPLTIIGTVVEEHKLLLLATVYGLLAFLPLLRPDVLILSLPTLAMTLLSDRPMLSSIRKQYPAALYPLAFIGAILAMETLLKHPALARRRRVLEPTLLGLVVALNVGAQWLSPPTTWGFLTQWDRPAFAPAVDKLLEKIPADAAVAVTSRLAPALARREHLYLFPPGSQGFYSEQPLRSTEYVLYETPKAGYEDPWLPILEQDPWVLIGVGHYEPREYRYFYRLYRRKATRPVRPPGDRVPVTEILGSPQPVSYTPPMQIQGASALVTGAGRGIGRAIALSLARAGAYVTAVSRTAVELDSLVTEIEAAGGKARAHAGDLREPQICDGAVEAAASHGRLQILVNNAGVGSFVPLAQTSDDTWETILGTNLTAVFRLTRAALPTAHERRGARLHDLVPGRQQRHRQPGRLLREQGGPRPSGPLPDARGPASGREGDDHRPGLGQHDLRRDASRGRGGLDAPARRRGRRGARPAPDAGRGPSLPGRDAPVDAQAALVTLAPARIAWRALIRFIDHGGPDRAAAVAYYTLLSLLPLLIFVISVGVASSAPSRPRTRGR